MKIERIENIKVPYDLLFLADEDDAQIKKYRDSAIFWSAVNDNDICGMIGLKEINKTAAEIVCLAVYEEFQNKGIGTELIETAIRYSKEESYKEVIIKTGSSGIKQLYLYQRCGFRLDSFQKDYFRKNYKIPIYENSVQCFDQVILKYRIYSQHELDKSVADYWDRFIKKNKEYENKKYEVWNFCYGEYLPNKLLGLVKTGKKTGTSSAKELYEEDEKIPEKGDLSIITYGNGLPGCIIETGEIRIRKFKDIAEEEAELEGEGDLSLSFWRKAHERFFRFEYEQAGREFTEEIPVIFERFEVVYDEDREYGIQRE